jgi:bifunctional DNase/RNase
MLAMSRAWIALLSAFLLVAGCRRASDKPRPRNHDGSCAPRVGTPGPLAHAPFGYVEMTVGSITPQGSSQARVELVSASHELVPVFVGGTEGTSLRLRMANEKAVRPLTHDLLDSALCELDADVVQAQIDELRDDVFIGTLVLRQHGRLIKIDARPSDAIAVAVGAKAPIYMAKRVLREAATPRDDDDDSASPARKR